MTIEQDVLNPNPSAYIELFEVNLSFVGYTLYTETTTPTINVIAGTTAITENYRRTINLNGPNDNSSDIITTDINTFPYNRSILIPASTNYNSGYYGKSRNRLQIIDCDLSSTEYAINFFIYIVKKPVSLVPSDAIVICFYDDIVAGSASGSWQLNWVQAGYTYNGHNSFTLGGLEYPCDDPFNQLIEISINWKNNILYLSINGVQLNCAQSSPKNNGILNFGYGYPDNIKMDLYFSFIRGYDRAIHTTNHTPNLPTSKLYLTNNTSNGAKVQFNKNEYSPWPLEISGLELNSSGSPARPTLTLGNLDSNKQLRKLAYTYNDLVGSEVTYIRTFKDYLGINSNISAPKIKFSIGRKLNHTKKQLQFELRSQMDRENSYLPPRIMLREEFPGLAINRGVS